MSGAGLDIALKARPEAAREARRAVERVGRELPADLLGDLKLMVSELVTNSYRHAGLSPGDEIRLRLAVGTGGVRVEVEDHGRFKPPDALRNGSGLGLRIVERLADRWGVESDNGTLAWFEVETGRSDSGGPTAERLLPGRR